MNGQENFHHSHARGEASALTATASPAPAKSAIPKATQTTDQSRFLKLREVQDLLGISRSTLWRWQAEHGLKVVRVGDVVRVRESDLQSFLSRHEQGVAGTSTHTNQTDS